jgi:hypothetical protein
VRIVELRADLPVPLRPAGMAGAVLRHGLALPRTPAFGRAHRQTAWCVAVALVLLVAGQSVVALDVRDAVTVAGVTLVVYATLRSVALRVIERRQHDFESDWLTERSAELRTGNFEVVRCSVDGRVYDLTDPEEVRDALDAAGARSRVEVDFLSSSSRLEQVLRRMDEVTVRQVLRPGTAARVRFTGARYGVEPSGERTYWQLGKPLTLTTSAPADPVAARAGTGSRARPGAARPAGGRRRGTTSA